jgi:hypothetical protein
MKPSPSPAAMTDAALALLCDGIVNRAGALTSSFDTYTIARALKARLTPAGDVDTVAQEICRALKIDPFQRDGFGDPSVPGGFREFERWEEFRDVAASLLASRGTRALTEEDRKFVLSVAAFLRSQDFDEWPERLIGLFDRLTGEPSA